MYRGGVHSFRCYGGSAAYTVKVYSASPLSSTWSTATPVQKTFEVCTRYEKTDEGKRVCTSTRKEVRTDTVRNSGRLDVKRIASADKP